MGACAMSKSFRRLTIWISAAVIFSSASLKLTTLTMTVTLRCTVRFKKIFLLQYIRLTANRTCQMQLFFFPMYCNCDATWKLISQTMAAKGVNELRVWNALSPSVHTGNTEPTQQHCQRHSGGKNPLWTFMSKFVDVITAQTCMDEYYDTEGRCVPSPVWNRGWRAGGE